MKRSVQVVWVLREFLRDPSQPQYGYSLLEATGLPSGSVYPILVRLTEQGWLARSSEDDAARLGRGGRLRRTLYTLTAEGKRAAREYVAAFDATQPHYGRIS